MIAKTLQRQKVLYEWIVRKLTERNSDNYFVYDMEAEYGEHKVLIDLLESVFTLNDEKFQAELKTILNGQIDQLEQAIRQQNEIYDAYKSTIPDRVASAFNQLDWEVIGDVENFVMVNKSEGGKVLRLTVKLEKGGFETTVEYIDGQQDASVAAQRELLNTMPGEWRVRMIPDINQLTKD